MRIPIILTSLIVLMSLVISCADHQNVPPWERSCESIAENEWLGKTVTNSFGRDSKILKISNIREISRSETKIQCRAHSTMSKGKNLDFTFTLSKDSDGDWWHSSESD